MPLGTQYEAQYMANTYTQIHIQTVFAVQNRQSLIKNEWKDELYKYITGIIQNQDHKVLQINGMPDHIHILFGMRPTQPLMDLMKQVKQDSSKCLPAGEAGINQKGVVNGKFSWQAGYGTFSYAKNDLPKIIAYIKNQEEHHRSKTFQEEYLQLLKDFEIDFENRYIFHPIE